MAKKIATKKKQTKKAPVLEEGKITRDMMIGDIVAKNRDAAIVMMQYGLHCIGCHVSAHESLAEGAYAHGLSDEQIDEMVDKINRMSENKE